jgi:nucleoside-diphosphate-sugar epimerase
VSRENLAAAIEFAAARLVAGSHAGSCEVFDVSDPETLSVGQLAALIAELGHAPPPRRVPDVIADLLAPIGDMISMASGREFPLTRARLRALREASDFPCDRLAAAGYVHPQSTRAGIGQMLDWLRREG